MKKYDLDNLVVIAVCSNDEVFSKTKLICERCFNPFKNSKSQTRHFFREIFTNQVIPMSDIKGADNFIDYYYKLSNNTKSKKIKLNKIELFSYYNEINRIELLKVVDNTIKFKESFESTKIYKKRYSS